jgi:NAD(P)-dependent dehydrogenase (short-subunit alcohol dehydrogenase family)
VAVIFGGVGRIGRAAAEAFLAQGASVLLLDRERDSLDTAAKNLSLAYPGKCEKLCLEIDTQEKAQQLADFIAERLGNVDILLNSPAYIYRAPFLEHSIEEVDRQWQTNFRIVYMVSQAVARLMAKRKSGKIINIASLGGTRPEKEHVGHCAVKSAVIALTKVMALELAEYNIQVNVIAPGPTETIPFSSPYYKNHPEALKSIEKRTPAGRIGHTSDHAGLLVFLASMESDWVTGQVILSDGGMGLT